MDKEGRGSYTLIKVITCDETDIGFNFNPHQNDQGRKGPCYFQRLIALKCLKCQKI